MHNLEKSPGMCSDRPGTTLKSLDLDVSPMCLRGKERELFGWCVRFDRGVVRGTPIISQVWPTPPFCPFVDCPRYPGGPSAYEFLHWHPAETASGKFCPTQADCPRSFGGLSAMYFWGWELLCRASGEQVSWTADCPPITRGLSAVPNFRLSRIVPTFSIPTSICDHCSYKNPKISNLAWKPSKDSFEQVTTRIQK